MAALTLLFAVLGAAWWVCSSPLRLGIAVAVIAAAPHAPSTGPAATGLAVLLGVVLLALLAVIVWRACAPFGWRLATTTKPAARALSA